MVLYHSNNSPIIVIEIQFLLFLHFSFGTKISLHIFWIMNQKEKMKISKRQTRHNFLGCSTKYCIILQLLCISFVPFCNGYVNVQTLTTSSTRKHALKVRADTKITEWNKLINSSSSSKVLSSLFSRQNGDDDDDDNKFNMEMLQSRISQVKERSNKLPLVVLDAMLPRQVLKVNVRNALLMELIRTRLEAEEPFFGMLGTARIRSPSNTPQTINLVHGVQVKILTSSSSEEDDDESTTKKFSDDTFRLHVQATNKRFVIDGDIESTPQGWTEAKVKYLGTKENDDDDEPNEESIQTAKNVLHDNLVNKWVELAEKRERFPGQIHQLLIDLGPMPSSDDPSDLALWIGALINPLPAMGVAMEIRPALLTATTSKDRIQIAHDGIIKSIHHMDGSKPMW